MEEESISKNLQGDTSTVESTIGSILKLIVDIFGGPKGHAPSETFWRTIKLIHADDLQRWDTLKEYREHDSITYAEYRDGVKRIDALKWQVREISRAAERLEQLDTEDFEEYDTIEIDVPRSLLRKELVIPLPDPPYEGTRMECCGGRIEGGNLLVKGTWREEIVSVDRSCPSNILHEEELDSIRKMLKESPQEDLDMWHEAKTSRFSQPVLFISHRWESATHPDPEGRQLEKLSALQNCYIVYDYSSFPQRTSNEGERAALEDVLANMNRLIKNVVILDSPTYLERGWCIYEYLVASLTRSTVCDEIRDSDFVKLRNLAATRPPPTPENHLWKGSSMESQLQNSISSETLSTVNRILPKFGQSRFSVEEDREIVTELLISRLQVTLPPQKEYTGGMVGEWRTVPWTREDLQGAFREEVLVGLDTSTVLHPYELKVPDTLEEAVAKGYALDEAPPVNSWTWILLGGCDPVLEACLTLMEGCRTQLGPFARLIDIMAWLLEIAFSRLI